MKDRKRRKYYRFLSIVISFVMILTAVPLVPVFADVGEVIETVIPDTPINIEPITPEPIDPPDNNGGDGEENGTNALVPTLPELNDIEDGVYAIQNVGNSTASYSMYMDVYNSYWYSGVKMQQRRLEGSTTPCDPFDMRSLFKITKVNGSYVIRSMRNNLLSFKIYQNSDGSYMYYTAEIPLDDSALINSDKFTITEVEAGSGQYTIQQNGTYKYITAPISSTNADLTASTSSGSRAQWRFIKYTGDDRNYVTFTQASMIAGIEKQVYPVFHSTIPGYNELTISIQSPATGCYHLDSSSAYGKFKITPYMKEDIVADVYIGNGSGSHYVTTITWNVGLLVEEGTYFLKNVRDTNKYVQINNVDTADDPGTIIELHNFHGYYDQRWQLTHLWNGYYKIESPYSELALTAPTGSGNSVVTQTAYERLLTQRWKFFEQSDGTYKISPESNSNYFMAAGDLSSTADQDLEIRTAQSDGGDRWELYEIYNNVLFVTYEELLYLQHYSSGQKRWIDSIIIDTGVNYEGGPYSSLFWEVY